MSHIPRLAWPPNLNRQAVTDELLERLRSSARWLGERANRSVRTVEERTENTRAAGSMLGVVILSLVGVIIVCVAIAVLWFFATVVFAPQLQLLSHVFFFTPDN